MLGEMIGFDGIGNDLHCAGAIALENTEVCALPFVGIESLARTMPALQHNLHKMMAREITRDHSRDAYAWQHASGRTPRRIPVEPIRPIPSPRLFDDQIVLRMTREEIGSYLGLKLETVSRLFSRFHQGGLIHVQGRTMASCSTRPR